MSTSAFKISIFLFLAVAFLQACVHEPDSVPIDLSGPPSSSSKCDPDSVYFENDILPLLKTNCAMQACHDAGTSADGVRLDSYQSIMQSDVIKARDPGKSDLWEAINETDPDDRMPLNGTPLTPAQKNLILTWIQQGARNNKCNAGCDTNVFSFAAAVSPILATNCVGCHKAGAASGGVILDNHAGVQTVAQSGLLYGVSAHLQGYKPMPYGGGKLSECNLTILKKWIDAGAPNN